MDETTLAGIEAGHPCKAGSGCALADLVAEVRRLRGCLAIAHDGYDTAHAELERVRARAAEAEGDYEQIRDAVLTHLALFAHDGDEPEPMIMAEAIRDAGEALGDLRRDEDSGELVSEEKERLRGREDAVFAKGYRAGYYDADERGITPFQSDVDEAHADWVRGGRKTHLDVDE